MKSKLSFFLTLMASLSLMNTSLYAGVVLGSNEIHKDSNSKTESEKVKIYMEKDKVRYDEIKEGKLTSTIYRKDTGKFWMIDHEKKSYTELTKQDLEKMKTEMKKAMSESLSQMTAGMSAEEQAQMNQMLASLGKEMGAEMQKAVKKAKQEKPAPQEITPKTVYKKTGKSKTVNQWNCEMYSGYEGSTKVEDVCVVNWRKLNLEANDFKIFEEMTKFFASMIPDGEKAVSMSFDLNQWEKDLGYPGFPVHSISYQNGSQNISELTEVRRESIANAQFQIPSGFKKEALNMGDGRSLSSE